MRQIVRNEEELRRAETRGDGLTLLHVALNDDAVDRRVDVRVCEILSRAIERHLRRLHLRARHVD